MAAQHEAIHINDKCLISASSPLPSQHVLGATHPVTCTQANTGVTENASTGLAKQQRMLQLGFTPVQVPPIALELLTKQVPGASPTSYTSSPPDSNSSTDAPVSPTQIKKKRTRVVKKTPVKIACKRCRRLKVRCDNRKPACTRCAKLKKTCLRERVGPSGGNPNSGPTGETLEKKESTEKNVSRVAQIVDCTEGTRRRKLKTWEITETTVITVGITRSETNRSESNRSEPNSNYISYRNFRTL